jgi:hypothetical protein
VRDFFNPAFVDGSKECEKNFFLLSLLKEKKTEEQEQGKIKGSLFGC